MFGDGGVLYWEFLGGDGEEIGGYEAEYWENGGGGS